MNQKAMTYPNKTGPLIHMMIFCRLVIFAL